MSVNIITFQDFSGSSLKCPYVLAYFRAFNLRVGDKWNTLDFLLWIDKKHEEFMVKYNISDSVSYYKGYNECLYKAFLEFIGYGGSYE